MRKALKAPQALPEPLVRRARLALVASRGRRAFRVSRVHKVNKAQQDQRDPRGLKATPDRQVQTAKMAHKLMIPP